MSNSSPYPKITSKEAKDALKKLKKLKEEIGSGILLYLII